MNYFEWPCDLFFSNCTSMVIFGISTTILVVVGCTLLIKNMIIDIKK